MQDMSVQRYKDLRPCLVAVDIGAYKETKDKAVREKAMPLPVGLCSQSWAILVKEGRGYK